MLEINIKNIHGRNFKAKFNTEEEAENWIADCISKESWGKTERWESITDETHTNTRVNEQGQIEYYFPPEFEISIEDISERENQESKYQEILKAGMNDRKCCEEILYLIGGYNRSRNLTAQQITKMIKDFADIDTCLAKGRPTSAKYLIEQLKIDGEILTQELYDLVIKAFERYKI